jgi:ubiquinone/menaquinone biosynthesis C-methylase UbiE
MIGTSEQNHRVLDQFSRQAEGYSRVIGGAAGADRRAAFRALIGAQPDDLVLDVCCGPGTMALDLAPHVAHVTGLDLTPAMLEQARRAQAERGCANVDWVEGDVFGLPFEDGSFSLVTCGAAFHHMVDPRPALREMSRVCRSGGRIVVRDVTPDAAKSAAYDRMERLRDPSHTHALVRAELACLGDGMPLGTPALQSSTTADLPLDAILAASFPEACTIADIRAMFLADALAGTDEFGFDARIIDGEIRVSYRQTTAIWLKR